MDNILIIDPKPPRFSKPWRFKEANLAGILLRVGDSRQKHAGMTEVLKL